MVASVKAIDAAGALADKYVVGASEVGPYRKMMPDYKGYVNTIAPMLDDLETSINQYMAERSALDQGRLH